MREPFKKGDRVKVILKPMDMGLEVGDKGYIIRDSRWGDPSIVAVIFEHEFDGAVSYTPELPVDEEVITRGIVEEGIRVASRSCWIKAKYLEPARQNEIQWIE